MLNTEDEKILSNDISMVKKFIINAFERLANHDSYSYDELVNQLKLKNDLETLWQVYLALCQCLSYLNKSPELYKEVFNAIYGFDWSCNDIKVYVAYKHLVLSIISSNIAYLVPFLNNLVKQFWFNIRNNNSDISEDHLELRRNQLHQTIQSILNIVPTGLSQLYPILEKLYPHKRFDISIQKEYVYHLLQICKYIPTLEYNILNLIISNCIEMDVDIIIEDSGLVQCKPNDNIELDDNSINHDNSNDIHNIIHSLNETIQIIPKEVIEISEKLDALLLLIIKYIDKQINKSIETLNYNSLDRLYNHLIKIFDNKILFTYKLKFTQFILFYITSKVDRYIHNFIKHLLSIFLNESLSNLKRQYAIIYLASYISRANFIPIEFVSSILSDMITWCSSYVILHETKQKSIQQITKIYPNMINNQLNPIFSEHELFYYNFQCICYILCFYGIELMNKQLYTNNILKSDWITTLTCQLNPLKYCLYSIRYEFIKLLDHIDDLSDDFIYNYKDVGSYNNLLDNFFPFDPCLLQSLNEKIDPIYRHWNGVPGLDITIEDDVISEMDCSDSNDEVSIDDDSIIEDEDEDENTNVIIEDVKVNDKENTFKTINYQPIQSYHESFYVSDELKTSDNIPSDLWTLPTRRPRNFSIGSTGSW